MKFTFKIGRKEGEKEQDATVAKGTCVGQDVLPRPGEWVGSSFI